LADLPTFIGFFSYYASGPPPQRLRELLALSEAGIVTFLGTDAEVQVDEDADQPGFVATGASVPDVIRTGALIEARIPRTSIACSTDQLVSTLYERGQLGEQSLQDGDLSVGTGRVTVDQQFQVIDAEGVAHSRLLAFGAWTSAATAAAFSRPGTNAPFFLQNDAAARQVLRLLQD
jgi:uncharacterized NAD(P)/FAD-binding protein YdhS